MKKVELMFYKTMPSDKNIGIKHVLFEITDSHAGIVYDWGYAYWNGLDWDPIEVPEGYTSKVVQWANTVNPEIVLKDDSKIIRL